MNGKMAKRCRRAAYAGFENHGKTSKDITYTDAVGGVLLLERYGDRNIYYLHKSIVLGTHPVTKEVVKVGARTLHADRFRNAYQNLKRQYTRGEGGWASFLAMYDNPGKKGI